MHQGSFLISSLMLPFPKLGIFALTVQRMLDHDIKAAHTHEERERERDEYAPCMHRVSWRACATPCIHTRPRPRRQRAWLHTALHTAQVFTLLFGLFLLLFWSTMFIAYPRAGGTQLELVPCNSRALYTYYASLYYDSQDFVLRP